MLKIATIILLATAPLQAQGSLADLVPPSTPVVLEFDDLGGAEYWKKNMALGRIWAEPEVQRFVKGLRTAIARGVAGQRARGPDIFVMAGLEPDDFLGITVRRGGVALIGIDPAREFFPDAVLALELRAGAGKVEKILGQFRMAFGMFLGSNWQSEQVGDATIWHVTVGNLEFAHAVVGSHVLFTTGRPRLKQTLAMLRGAKMARLSGEKTYRATRASMKADRAAMFCYVNARGLHRMMESTMGERNRAFVRDLLGRIGLDAVESVALADIPAGPNLRTEFCVRYEEARGILGLYQSAATTHRFAGRVPRNPLLYAAERFDLSRFVRDLIAWTDGFQPGTRAEFDAILARYREVLGIDVEKDLIGSLGDEWAAYVGDTPGGSLIPDMVLLVGLEDRARFEKSVRALVEGYPKVLAMYGEKRAASVRHRRTQYAGRDIHLLELATHRGEPIPIVPCWTVADDHVAFALYPQALKHLLGNRPSFDGNRAFAGVLEHVPVGAASQSYFDLPRVVGFAYNSLVPVLQGLQGAIDRELKPFGTAINLHDLPTAAAITKHLSPCVGYTKVDDRSIRMGYVSPCGISLLVAPAAGVGVLAALAERGRQQEILEEALEGAEKARLAAENARLRAQLRAERAKWSKRLADLEARVEELVRLLRESE